MTTTELRELDAWIARLFPEIEFEGVQDNDPHRVYRNGQFGIGTKTFGTFSPTTDPAAAMEVLKECHKKLAFGIKTQQVPSGWNVCSAYPTRKMDETAETLELAICLFAKKLFTK